MFSRTSLRGKADNAQFPGSSLFRFFLTAKEGRETSVCKVQVRLRPQSSNYLHSSVKYHGLGNNLLQHEGSASDLQRDLAATEESQKDSGKKSSFLQSSESHNTEMECTARNQELPPKGSLGAATGDFSLGKAPARNRQLGVSFAWSISGHKKDKPKNFLEIVTELEIAYIGCCKRAPIWKCLHNQFSLRFSKICVWIYQCCDPG